MTLTADQLLTAAMGRDVRFSQNGVEYVVISSEKFDEIRDLLNQDHEGLCLLLARSSAGNGWDEPGMEAYDSYPEKP
jgi:hypothetical protein